MKAFKKIDSFFLKFTKAAAFLSVLGLMAIIGILIVDIILRFAFSSSIPPAYELVQIGMVFVVFFSFAYAQRSGALVHVTFFMRKLPWKFPQIMWTLTMTASAVTAFFLTFASWQSVGLMKKLHSATTIMKLQVHPFYLAMTIAFAIFAVSLAVEAIKCWVGLFNKEVGEDVIAHWPI